MRELKTFRQNYPQYDSIDDATLADKLAQKYPEAYGNFPEKFKESRMGEIRRDKVGEVIASTKDVAKQIGSLLINNIGTVAKAVAPIATLPTQLAAENLANEVYGRPVGAMRNLIAAKNPIEGFMNPETATPSNESALVALQKYGVKDEKVAKVLSHIVGGAADLGTLHLTGTAGRGIQQAAKAVGKMPAVSSAIQTARYNIAKFMGKDIPAEVVPFDFAKAVSEGRMKLAEAARKSKNIYAQENLKRGAGVMGKAQTAEPIQRGSILPQTRKDTVLQKYKPVLESGKTPFEMSGVTDKQIAIQPESLVTSTLPININQEDIPYKIAESAHQGSSFSSEKRARQTQQDYINSMQEMYDNFKDKAKTPEQQIILKEELQRYKDGYIKRTLSMLSTRSGILNPMVTGRGNFPVARNNKRLEVEDNKRNEFFEWKKKVESGIERKLRIQDIKDQGGELEVLKNRVKKAETMQVQMKQANAIIRNKKISDEEKISQIVDKVGISREAATKLFEPDFAGRKGFPQFRLTNNNANIKRMKSRVAQMETQASKTGSEVKKEYNGVKVVENNDIDRLQLLFDGKPSDEMINELKKSGWRWSPREKAWQRKLTANARYSANRLLSKPEPKTQTSELATKAQEYASFSEVKDPKFALKKKPITPAHKVKKAAKDKDMYEKQLELEDAKQAKEAVNAQIRKRTFSINLKNYETNKFINEIEQQTTKEQREVLPFVIEGTDVPDALKRPELQEIDRAELQGLANTIKEHFNKGWDYIVANTPNLSVQQIDDYVTHIWEIPKVKKREITNWFITNNKFLKKRYIATLKEGIEKFGLTPKYTDITDIIRIHDNITNKTIENIKFVKWLKKVNVKGAKVVARADKAPADWVMIDHPALKETVIIPGEEKMAERVSPEMQDLLTDMGIAIGRRISPVAFGKPVTKQGSYNTGKATNILGEEKVLSAPEIKLKRFFSDRTLAHEIGHHIDMTLKLGDKFLNKYKDELYKVNEERIKSFKGTSKEQYAESTEEQIAEFFSLLFTDAQKASEIAPSATLDALSRLRGDEVLTKLIDFDFENKAKLLLAEQLTTLAKLPIKVHPDLEKSLRVIFDARHHSDLIQGYEKINGFLKKTQLSLSLFHHMALGETSIATQGLLNTLNIYFNPVKIYKALAKGNYAVFDEEPIARRWIERGLQLGATADIPVNKIQESFNQLAKKTKDVPLANMVTKFLATFNETWDKALWNYLHDTMKLYGAEHLGQKIDITRDVARQEEEIAQLVNDTFGGQNWEALLINPKTVQTAGWLLLSPDWTFSTVRQALAPTGIGAIHKETKGLRQKLGVYFWLKAALYYGIGINLINAATRKYDRQHNPNYYKGESDTFMDYTMFGNTIGHGTHLFAGRYKDGTERYIRWGKQFRELPEMFFDDREFSPISASMKKIGGKTSPIVQRTVESFTGVTPSGFANRDIRDEKGWQRVKGVVKTLLSSPFPFSLRSVVDPNKDFNITDLAMPSSKGMSRYKTVDLFKTAILKKDERLLKEVWQGAQRNGLAAASLYKTAQTSVKSENSKSITSMMKSLEDVDAKLKENITQRERLTLMRKRKRYLVDQKLYERGGDLLSKAVRDLDKLNL